MNNIRVVCPFCGATAEIVSDTDWDTLVTQYYPVCHECGFSTKSVFETPEAAVQWVKDHTGYMIPQEKE